MIFINHYLIGLIRWYQRVLSPLYERQGHHCIYPVPCSEYSIQKLESENVLVALPKIIWRLLSCNPLNGYLKHRLH